MSRDENLLDSHKLSYHPGRVAAWLEAGGNPEALAKVYPIYLEISPIGACNHRCSFCALDFMGYRPVSLDADILAERLAEMGSLGVKSVMFAGEGEPLLHKRMAFMTEAAHAAGIDTAFTTNGVLLRGAVAETVLGLAAWVKVSLNAATPETYAAIHGTDPKDLGVVLDNLRRAAAFPGRRATLGAQMLLLPENAAEVVDLARLCREAGLDYLVVKPYSQHPQSLGTTYQDVTYERFLDLEEALAAQSTPDFSVIFRARTMKKYRRPKPYGRCLSTPVFWAYVASDGAVYSCSMYLGDPRFNLGNLHERSFRDIWEGPARRANLELVQNGLDISQCRSNCRMDEVNAYLWRLATPPAHVNFI